MDIAQYSKMNISQQQDESSLITKKLENELTKYKSQNKKLKTKISTLENRVNLQDQQLDDKSKYIISCISENLRLKQQIETLKRQLNITQVNSTRKKITNTPKSIELTSQSIKSFDSTTDENVSISVTNQMPYFMPSITRNDSFSVSSNLSEQACKISFPPPNKIPTNNSQLSPIEESDDQYRNAFTPITVMSDNTPITMMSDLNCSFKMMAQSDNNSHIEQNEWNESIATISTTPSPKSIPLVNTNYCVPQILSVQVQSDDEENVFGSITSMTLSSTTSRNNSESGFYNYDKSMPFTSGKHFTHSTILNILNEDKSDHSCNTVPYLRNVDSYISIID